jgi:hypothetical protein
MSTDSQINANRANAQHSTGPSSPEGKLKSSHNALKTGLTGRTILLPTDDVAAYRQIVAIVNDQWRPETDPEKLVVQSIVDTQWRLLRIPTLESAIWALGRSQCAAECAAEPDVELRALMIDGLVLSNRQKDFSNLILQEGRLQRHLEKLIAQFKQLRDEREIPQRARRDWAMRRFVPGSPSFNPAEFGFEFSKEYLKARRDLNSAQGSSVLPYFDRAWRDKSQPTAA